MRSSLEADESESRPRHLSSDAEQLLPTDPLAEDPTLAIPFVEGQQLTPRAIIVGLVIGTLACFSNSYFGLQTGWISMMSLPLSLLGFAVFKAFSKHLSYPFSPVENVLVQTVAVAVGTLPVGAGLVGIIPALEKLLLREEGGPVDLGYGRLVIWSMGVAFFGVFFAVPLRRQVIIREKLRFPSGHATATMIGVLHDKPRSEERVQVSWKTKINSLLYSFAFSSTYTIISYFLPILASLPIFSPYLKEHYLWSLSMSPAYIGQGIIMGLPTTLSMLLGAILGWGILAPLAKYRGWAPGEIDDWKTGGRGWILWISLGIMLSDCIIGLSVVTVNTIAGLNQHRYERIANEDKEEEDAPEDQRVSNKITFLGLAGSSLLCVIAVKIAFNGIPIYAIVVAIAIALVLSVLGVRALGETDLNPVSGIGKVSQLVFALVIPRSNPNAIIINLIAGGIAEAGAQQAGDLMQDLKTGHLLGASPKVQFYGQLIGSVWSAIISAGIYKLYTRVYEIPGALFQIPTAQVWLDCARLVNNEGLPENVATPTIVFAAIFGVVALLKTMKVKYSQYLPSGLAAAVGMSGIKVVFNAGMYNTPSFTLARVVGGVASWWWIRRCDRRGEDGKMVLVVILASGFVLGEGVCSIINLGMAAAGV